MTLVEIYSKPDCHLCEQAKEKLLDIRKRHPFELRETVVQEGDARFAEYSDRVPVIVVDNSVKFYFRVPEKEFIEQLNAVAR